MKKYIHLLFLLLVLTSCEVRTKPLGTKPISVITFHEVDLQVLFVQNESFATLYANKDGKIGQMEWRYGRGNIHDVFLNLYWDSDTLFVYCRSEHFVQKNEDLSSPFFIPLWEKSDSEQFDIEERAQRSGCYFSFYSAPFADDWARNIGFARSDSLHCDYLGLNKYNYNYSQISYRFYPPTGYWKSYWTLQLLGKKYYDEDVNRLLNQEQSVKEWYEKNQLNSMEEYSRQFKNEKDKDYQNGKAWN